ncbi:ABC transporter permease [Candidatus Woesearchaeota archaeon]|nr:ABC transporter permease [Candidatus Woesearchaeota archaeon]
MSRFTEFFNISFQSLKRRRLRSWLTMIGIFIGIAAVVSLISLGQGMEDAIYEQFENIGSDKLFVQPKTGFGGTGGDNTGFAPLTENDVRFLENQGGVKAVSSYVFTSAKVEFQGSTKYFNLLGIPTEPRQLELIAAVMGTDIDKGRMLEQGDNKVAAVGFYHAERNLYDGRNMEVNNKFTLNDEHNFRVIGIFEPIGSGEDDTMIVIPLDVLREVTGIEERIDFIIVQVNEGTDPRKLGDELERSLARYRDVKEGQEDFSIQTPEDLLASFETILAIVRWVLIGIASISLLVGAIGIMNTMYTSVLERNKDIGIMKAIGAKNSDIFTLFLIESGLLGLVGGILGVIIGIGLAKLVEVISAAVLGKTFLIAHLSIELVAISLGLAFIVGALAGSLPALQAAKLQPVETLRDE